MGGVHPINVVCTGMQRPASLCFLCVFRFFFCNEAYFCVSSIKCCPIETGKIPSTPPAHPFPLHPPRLLLFDLVLVVFWFFQRQCLQDVKETREAGRKTEKQVREWALRFGTVLEVDDGNTGK